MFLLLLTTLASTCPHMHKIWRIDFTCSNVHDAVEVYRWQSSRLVNSAQVSLVSCRSVHRLTLLPPRPEFDGPASRLCSGSSSSSSSPCSCRALAAAPLLPSSLLSLARSTHATRSSPRDAANGAAAVSDAQRAMAATGIMTAAVFSVCVSTVSGLALDIA